jgi:hypothetical protein
MAIIARKPSKRDLVEVGRAIESFHGYGSVNTDGEFKPSVADPNMLVLFAPISKEQMIALWLTRGISTTGESSYRQMLASADHCVDVYFHKAKKGLFGAIWIGTVGFNFARSQMPVGCVSGRSQAAMWKQFRAFIAGTGSLYDDTQAAWTAAL